MSGWYSVKRGILDHELFAPKGPWSRAEAWLWMIENAAFKDTTINLGGKPHVVPRGSLCFSERFMADKFGWSQKALRTFLSALEMHSAITQSVEKTGQGTKSKRKQITLCNYDKYQSPEIKTEAKRNQNGSKEEQGNNTSVSKDTGAVAPTDPDAVMFACGKKLLAAAGIAAPKAGALLGRWRRDHGTEAVITAIGKAQREGAIEPVAFIEGCFRFQARNPVGPAHGSVRVTTEGRRQVYRQSDGWVNEYV